MFRIPEFITNQLKYFASKKRNFFVILLSDDEILNRNVILRKFDDDGWIFVTERNTKKYKDFVINTISCELKVFFIRFTHINSDYYFCSQIKNPLVAATILWIYSMNGIVIYRQV